MKSWAQRLVILNLSVKKRTKLVLLAWPNGPEAHSVVRSEAIDKSGAYLTIKNAARDIRQCRTAARLRHSE